jgi:predicted Zn-dependent peptidase
MPSMKIKVFILIIVILIVYLPGALLANQPSIGDLPSPEHLKYPALKFKFPNVERKILSNGIVFHIAEDHELPLVKISVLVKVGNSDDPSGKEGLAKLTGKVMTSGGTIIMTGNEIDEALSFIAADISCDVHLEYSLFTLTVLKKDVDKALEIFSQILKNPIFEQEKLQVAKNLEIEELRRISDNPDSLAFRQYRKLLYKGDQRGRLSTVVSLDRIGRDDLRNFHESYYYPENIMMAVSGDVGVDEVNEKMNRYFGDWRERGQYKKNLPAPIGVNAPSISFIQKETPQSIIIYGCFGPSINSPDFYAFTLLDFILGSGGFQSRIFREIRTKRGLAYTSGSFYQGRKSYGIFESYAITKSGSTVQVLDIIIDIIKKIRTEKISLYELQWAKNAIRNNFIFSFKTANDVAVQQMMMEYNELSKNFLEKYSERIEAVKIEDIINVASKYLDFQNAVILVVGAEKEFDAPLSKYGRINREDIL